MSTPERIEQIARGLSAAAILLSALELDLFTELGKGPRSYRQLRRALGHHHSQARRRALTSHCCHSARVTRVWPA
jgi:hypothetical protein